MATSRFLLPSAPGFSHGAGLSGSIGLFPRPAPVDPRVSRVAALMHRAMHRKLPLRELAGASGLSVSRLCHLFQSEVGTSARRYLKAARLARAKELLETSSLSVKEVAARAGFDHVGRFIGDFRKAYGLTPSAHRRAELRSELSTDDRELMTAVTFTEQDLDTNSKRWISIALAIREYRVTGEACSRMESVSRLCHLFQRCTGRRPGALPEVTANAASQRALGEVGAQREGSRGAPTTTPAASRRTSGDSKIGI